MPNTKKIQAVSTSTASAAKPKKKHTSPPLDDRPDEKPHKPGKKHAKEQDDKPAGKHLRRAYEHLGRVEALQSLTDEPSIATLVRLAQLSVDRSAARPAADLLRAAEHLSFAAAATRAKSAPAVSPDLEKAIRREFGKLLEHAEDHELARASTLGLLHRQTVDDARTAFDDGSFRQALELARAAESLATLDGKDADKLDDPDPKRALKS